MNHRERILNMLSGYLHAALNDPRSWLGTDSHGDRLTPSELKKVQAEARQLAQELDVQVADIRRIADPPEMYVIRFPATKDHPAGYYSYGLQIITRDLSEAKRYQSASKALKVAERFGTDMLPTVITLKEAIATARKELKVDDTIGFSQPPFEALLHGRVSAIDAQKVIVDGSDLDGKVCVIEFKEGTLRSRCGKFRRSEWGG